ncbi:DNA adenine methylase [Natrialba taiwanensis]|uniref:site-specific DNA-methyltransferase (adenine-specific) n=1 Tax=Natrialba taiwanensis DSM 12281 TaxID=1230458 RepID=M0A272_9EURY|nr:DNA adenine methylase [Natrialba taiwanensis]ELY91438.1 D12 class N6 adenine-specific DNA methyltransferase [Natrialba taiwanensis DSM 12281]
MKSVFPYPGGKAKLADWIVSHFPDHGCYVEVFSGSAAVLVSKPETRVEVLNDLDGDIVHFFKTLRDRGNELREWLRNTPFSRELHDEYATEFYDGKRPDDDIERAGKFFYLRSTQFSTKYASKSGFATSKHPQVDQAGAYMNRAADLDEFSDRLRDVVIESKDFGDMFDTYDGAETLFYCDPPYVGPGDSLYSHGGEFEHRRLMERVAELEGKVIISYEDLPESTPESFYVAEKGTTYSMGTNGHDERKEATERLVMNFDPEEVTPFAGVDQANLEAFGD